MMHFTCDGCGKDLAAEDRDRYEVRIDVRAANDPWQLSEEDVEEDNLQKVSKLLDEYEQSGEAPLDEDRPVHKKLDLCARCRERFLKDPFRQKAAEAKFDFSNN